MPYRSTLCGRDNSETAENKAVSGVAHLAGGQAACARFLTLWTPCSYDPNAWFSPGGISITNEDVFCLNEGEFLNDVIIDFYLKYLLNEIMPDREKTFIFSSFFYKRLTQKPRKGILEDNASQTMQVSLFVFSTFYVAAGDWVS
jgi:hypothetical protein